MNPAAQLGDLLVAINKEIKIKVERDLKQYGIGMGQLHILMIFYANTGNTFSQNDLAKILNVDKGNISRSVAKLMDKDYLEQDSINPRLYQLSEKGRQLKAEVMSCFGKINEWMTLGIEENDLKQTVLILNRILGNLEETK